MIDRHLWSGLPVLITGHTGFKGSWLSWWLSALGARVTGISDRVPTTPSLYELLDLRERVVHLVGDVRNAADVAHAVRTSGPRVVVHLAAQSLVRRSYRDPLETWSTNVQGTAVVLDTLRASGDVQAVIVVTSDKCYRNDGSTAPFAETDPLGGHDPYSASKAAAELVTASFRSAYVNEQDGDPGIATARAGNVVGGGDWAEDRLIPDAVRAWIAGRALAVRNPQSVRPWQHVLDPLHGYLLLAQRLLSGDLEARSAYNFGPDEGESLSVSEVLEELRDVWNGGFRVDHRESDLYEAPMLRLDARKARRELSWAPVWSSREGIRRTATWYKAFRDDGSVEAVRRACDRDLSDFLERLPR